MRWVCVYCIFGLVIILQVSSMMNLEMHCCAKQICYHLIQFLFSNMKRINTIWTETIQILQYSRNCTENWLMFGRFNQFNRCVFSTHTHKMQRNALCEMFSQCIFNYYRQNHLSETEEPWRSPLMLVTNFFGLVLIFNMRHCSFTLDNIFLNMNKSNFIIKKLNTRRSIENLYQLDTGIV